MFGVSLDLVKYSCRRILLRSLQNSISNCGDILSFCSFLNAVQQCKLACILIFKVYFYVKHVSVDGVEAAVVDNQSHSLAVGESS